MNDEMDMNPLVPAFLPEIEPITVLAPEDRPCIEHLVTEDDTPVDNFPSEKQQRLLAEPLYSSWVGPGEDRSFLAAANVGLFFAEDQPPFVPDFLLSLDVCIADDWWQRRHRSYFFWVFGKMPEVIVEIVSNLEGGEADSKFRAYARLGIPYYVIYDPQELLKAGLLRLFVLQEGKYQRREELWLSEVGLGLRLWRGSFEGKEAVWLRWCDRNGRVLPTGAERAEEERLRAERERQRAEQAQQQAEQAQQQAEQAQQQAEQAQQQAEQERLRADQAQQQAEQERLRAKRLAEQLRSLGIDPTA